MDMTVGTYIRYDTHSHGKGTGQILNIITRNGEEILLVEPFYTKKDRQERRELSTIIELRAEECFEDENANTHERIRYR